MKLGQHYIYKDRQGRDQEKIWIESVLDLQRYFDENVYCIDSGFCLAKGRNFPKLWKTVDSRIQKLLKVSDKVKGINQ